MYCGNCGKQTSDTQRYCEHCHFDLIHIQRLLNEPDEDDDEVQDEFRVAADAAKRCLILSSIVAAAQGDDRAEIVSWLKGETLWEDVSPEEKSFLQSKKPAKQKVVNASWRIEALHLLLWALKRVPAITDSTTRADPDRLIQLLPFLASTSEFIANSELRPEDEIAEMNEAIYQAHWSVRDARLHDKPAPEGIDPDIIVERHHAINWLMGYCSLAWDDVTTDT